MEGADAGSQATNSSAGSRESGAVPNPSGGSAGAGAAGVNQVVVKVGMVGDAGIGKTSLMVKYVENKFDEDYIQTLGALPREGRRVAAWSPPHPPPPGVSFMERKIRLRSTHVLFSIWDLGGSRCCRGTLPARESGLTPIPSQASANSAACCPSSATTQSPSSSCSTSAASPPWPVSRSGTGKSGA